MNLLSSVFDTDHIGIIRINKKYIKIMVILLVLIIILLFTTKDNYYRNTFTKIDEKTILFVDKDYVNKVKKENTIIINGVETKYNINNITSENDIYLFDVSIETNINNVNNGVYKINLGKEKLFDYILRIIKK